MVEASLLNRAVSKLKTSSGHESYPPSAKASAYCCRLSDESTAAIGYEPSAGGAAPMKEEEEEVEEEKKVLGTAR